MKKSCAEIESINKKPLNQERVRLKAKMHKHIDRIMGEYVPVIE
jgi:hypothetical protein